MAGGGQPLMTPGFMNQLLTSAAHNISISARVWNLSQSPAQPPLRVSRTHRMSDFEIEVRTLDGKTSMVAVTTAMTLADAKAAIQAE